MNNLENTDPEIKLAIKKEILRQENNINLIASENFVSKAVREAQSSVMTNKYAEGYPGKRYYGGCEFVDEVEILAINRLKELFHAEHANVQPHSGAQANMAAYFAVLKPGDTVLGMDLAHGGHLTHGSKVNFSSKLYNFISYRVKRDTELIDYEEVLNLSLEHKPKLIVAGATAYTRTIDFAKFKEIADEINAILMVDMSHISGLIAANQHPSPIGFADIVTSTTHKTLRGPRGGIILSKEKFQKKIDRAVFPNAQGGPMMHTIAAKAVAFQEAKSKKFIEYQKSIKNNAHNLASELNKSDLRLVSGGTDNHMVLVDVSPLKITGKDAEDILSEVNIVVNRNAIPFDTNPPSIASGLRLGTPSITTRGFDNQSISQLAQLIIEVLTNYKDTNLKNKIKKEVLKLTGDFSLLNTDFQ